MLTPGGRVVITVPSKRVDDILHVLLKLRLLQGMSAHEHYGYKPSDTLGVFPPPRYRLLRRETFELRLNNLFVFELRRLAQAACAKHEPIQREELEDGRRRQCHDGCGDIRQRPLGEGKGDHVYHERQCDRAVKRKPATRQM